MADSDLELEGRGEGGFVLLALPPFPPSVISSFFTRNKRDCRPRRSSRFATVMYLVERIIVEVDLNLLREYR